MTDETLVATVSYTEAEVAYQNVADEIDQMPAELVQPINASVPKTAGRVLGYEPGIVGLIPEMREHCPAVSLVPITKLKTLALAAFHAHAVAAPIGSPSSPLGRLIPEGEAARENLLVWAPPLVHEGVLDGATIERIREGKGFYDLAIDLASLASIYGERATEIASMTALTHADFEHARQLGTAIFSELGRREKSTVGTRSLVAERRARAYTLMRNAYDYCQRVVVFLRWNEGDADVFAPSLFARRRPRRKAETKPEVASPPPLEALASAAPFDSQ